MGHVPNIVLEQCINPYQALQLLLQDKFDLKIEVACSFHLNDLIHQIFFHFSEVRNLL